MVSESPLYQNLTYFCDVMSVAPRISLVIALMSKKTLSASYLARQLSMSPQATRFHLRKLEEIALISSRTCGRYHYYEISDHLAAEFIEKIFCIIPPSHHLMAQEHLTRNEFEEARTCYNHLAGYWAVKLTHKFIEKGLIIPTDNVFAITSKGASFLHNIGITIPNSAELFAKRCIDVTEHNDHIGGQLGNLLLESLHEKNWIISPNKRRILLLTPLGKRNLKNFLQ